MLTAITKIDARPMRMCRGVTDASAAVIGPRLSRVSPGRRHQPKSSSEMSFVQLVYVESSVERDEVIMIRFMKAYVAPHSARATPAGEPLLGAPCGGAAR